MDADRRLDEYASRQYGAFSLTQARDLDFTKAEIGYRLREGAWIRLASGVYALASAPPKWERQLSAAILSRPGSIVGGRSAAHLHGFDGFGIGRPEIVVTEEGNHRSPIARVIRSKYFDELGVMRLAGFPVTDPYETVLHLASRVSSKNLERLVDDGMTANLITSEGFDPLFVRSAGGRVRGVGGLAEIVDVRRPDAWEPGGNLLERLLNQLVDHPDIPPASHQVPFQIDPRPMIVDIYIAAWRLILEADGRRYHTRREDFERDRHRDNLAAAAGIAVLRYTWSMLTRDFDNCQRQVIETGHRRVVA